MHAFNLLSLMTMLSGVYAFPEPFAKIPQSWNSETSAMNIEQNHSCCEWWKHGVRWYLQKVFACRGTHSSCFIFENHFRSFPGTVLENSG